MRLIDTHCHLNLEEFERDWREIASKALVEGVQMIVVGIDLESSRKAVEIARAYNGIWAAVGLHPSHTVDRDFEDEKHDIAELAMDVKVVAIGEVGFDYSRLPEDEKQRHKIIKDQIRLFDFFVNTAQDLTKPLIIHNRDALGALRNYFEEDGKKLAEVGGVVHCYPGDALLARMLFAHNFKIGFNGMITYNPRWEHLIRNTDLKHILVETDAPFLTPTPYRGQRNEPIMVKRVAEEIARLKNVSVDEVESVTTDNARELFRLDLS